MNGVPPDLDPDLVARLVCPATRTPLRHDAGLGGLVSDDARLVYPIRDGVPVLIVEAAHLLDDVEPVAGGEATE